MRAWGHPQCVGRGARRARPEPDKGHHVRTAREVGETQNPVPWEPREGTDEGVRGSASKSEPLVWRAVSGEK